MQTSEKCDRLPIVDGYLCCPVCARARRRSKLIHLDGVTVAENFPLFCPKCKTVTRINIRSGQCSRSQCP